MRKLIIILIVAATSAACGGNNHNHSTVEGLASFLLPRPRASLKVADFSVEMVSLTMGDARRVVTASARANVKEIYLKETLKAGGMPSWQGKRVMADLLDASSGACGGASCEKAFGIKANEIDSFFDDTQADLLQSAELLKTENAEARQTLLASMQKAEDPLDAAIEPKALEVNFTKAKETYAKAVSSDVTTSVGPFSAGINITPQDLLNAKSMTCREDACDVLLNKNINFNVQLPLGMRPEVSLTLKRTAAGNGLQVNKSGAVGIAATPINLGEIIRAKVSLKAAFSQEAGSAPVIKDVNCTGELSCKLPFVKFTATVDKSGIEFDGMIDTQLGGPLIKAMPLGKVSARINYADIPDKIRDMRDAIANATSGKSAIGKPDASWSDIAAGLE